MLRLAKEKNEAVRRNIQNTLNHQLNQKETKPITLSRKAQALKLINTMRGRRVEIHKIRVEKENEEDLTFNRRKDVKVAVSP